jgi:hypothetical protein
MRILETLARVELTDGFDFAHLVIETASRMPRDATVIAVLPSVTMETAVSLGNLRRGGFAVTAILIMYDYEEYSQAAGKLMAEGVETRQLPNKEALVTVCRDYVLS